MHLHLVGYFSFVVLKSPIVKAHLPLDAISTH
jgi:hypothetical protein